MSWTVSEEEFSVYSRDVLRARPLGSLAASLMGVVAIAILTGALWFVGAPAPTQDVASSSPAPVAASAPAQPRAQPIASVPNGPGPAVAQIAGFDLDAPEFSKEKKSFSAQRGGGRQDTLVLGAFESGKPYLRFDVLQAAGEKLGNSDFYLDMARHAARADLAVSRIGPPTSLTSRLGIFESADSRISSTGEGGAPAAGGERGCLAVRLLNPKLSIEIAGLACGAAGKPFDRRSMACVLDRLRYVPSAENKVLEQVFPNAPLEQGCASAPASAPAAAKAGEADAGARKKRAAAARR